MYYKSDVNVFGILGNDSEVFELLRIKEFRIIEGAAITQKLSLSCGRVAETTAEAIQGPLVGIVGAAEDRPSRGMIAHHNQTVVLVYFIFVPHRGGHMGYTQWHGLYGV